MKYFTLEWWREGDDGSASERYSQYVESVKARLQPALIRLHEICTLHDGCLRAIEADMVRREAILDVDGHRYIAEERRYGRREFRLLYGDVLRLGSTATPEHALGGPPGFGDLGYDEIELIADGVFEHRMLFSSGIEIAVQFGRFELQYWDSEWPSRRA